MKFLLSIFFATIFFTSEITVKGTVYDEYVETIEGVTVECNGKKIKTSAEGSFSIEGIEKLPIKIVFSKEGYENREIEVKGQDEELEVVLTEL